MIGRSVIPDPPGMKFDPKMSDEDFLTYTRAKNIIGMEYGVAAGWWESYDSRAPVPFPIVISAKEFGSKCNMSHIMVAAKMFPSISEARKNGWNKPIVKGDYRVGKFRYRVQVVD